MLPRCRLNLQCVEQQAIIQKEEEEYINDLENTENELTFDNQYVSSTVTVAAPVIRSRIINKTTASSPSIQTSDGLSSGHAVKVKVYLANEARATMEKEVTLLPFLYISKTKYLPMFQSLPAPFIVIPMKWFF